MSSFGDSRGQSPSDPTDAVDENDVTTLSRNSKEITSSEYHTDSPGAVTDGESWDESSQVFKLSKKEYQKYRRWYYHDLNLVNAVETAASKDLAHNLLGFALEKKARLLQNENANRQPWTSKLRGVDREDGPWLKTLRVANDWVAWPLPLDEFPQRGLILSDPRPEAFLRPRKRRRKIVSPITELEDALCSVAMEHARSQFAQYSSVDPASRSDHAEQEQDTQIPNLADFEFSIDDDHSASVLKPVIQRTIRLMDKLFAGLQTSQVAQRSGGSINSKPSGSTQQTSGVENLRDWSDVLAMAAVVGWDANVLTRTIERCSKMFGETMSTLPLSSLEELSSRTECIPYRGETLWNDPSVQLHDLGGAEPLQKKSTVSYEM
ncbi:uncharacterized protein PV09_07020 [Verruconis gallopava]|uniref:Rrn9 domain-containing protein n=1 Tax=Verruconis gallopava TaxID=253628 RepID=A0A0D1YL67_9PEZI|nr:uncharacterized protein PV09_07020 [Verruconis gallopava]KIW01542.1 hypothetical protein PV09_07020 [Verruconis gallopava]